MASKEDVEGRLDELIDRLAENDEAARALGRSLPEPRILTLHVTDLDLTYWTELSNGTLGPLTEAQPSQAHIKITTSSDDLVSLIEGGQSFFSAYVAGRVRVEASFADLLKLRKLT